MEKVFHHSAYCLVFILLLICGSESEQSSEFHSLLRVKRLLYFPSILSEWNKNTDFCNSEPNPCLTVMCYQGSITQLHIIGQKGAPLLPRNFSIHSLFTTIAKLHDLRVVTLVSLGLWGPFPAEIQNLQTLEILNMSSNFLYGSIPPQIASLTGLRTLILDDNMLAGHLPDWLTSLPLLTLLSLNKNSFNGSLPISFGHLQNLRVLVLSHNNLFGEVPDLSGLMNLQVLELDNNAFGPNFPRTGNKVVTLALSKNRFRSAIPSEVDSYYQLERIDLSFNSFVGPFPQSLLSLPSIKYLNVDGNKFTGMLFSNQSCNPDLEIVNLSSNLLTGSIPNCLVENSKGRLVLYANNCLSTPKQNQYPLQHCHNEAFAVGISTVKKKQKQVSKALVAFVILGCAFGAFVIVGVTLLIYRRLHCKAEMNKTSTRSITENASTGTGYTSRLLSATRFISQPIHTGSLGLPGYRTFSLEELKEATNNFDTSALIGERSDGQMYRGLLKDGSYIAIRCRKIKGRHGTQNFMQSIKLISKLRHKNLVSAVGHCFECYLDDSSVCSIFLVFEYVPNGTLRSWISDKLSKRTFTWTQRISVAIGIAKGIQFLHNGVRPAIYRNNLKITDVLVDYGFNAKISSYNVPLLRTYSIDQIGHSHAISSSTDSDVDSHSRIDNETTDVYDFGVILLEIIKGRQVISEKQVDALIDQMQVAIRGDKAGRRSMVDEAVKRICLDESLKTIMEICVKCLQKKPEDRPSFEDILWNLQYSAQIQSAWTREPHDYDDHNTFTSSP